MLDHDKEMNEHFVYMFTRSIAGVKMVKSNSETQKMWSEMTSVTC